MNNAGTASSTTLPEYTPEELAYDFGVNVFATVYLTQAVTGPGNMPRGGRIINISTIVSKHGPEMGAIYAASKAAQDSLTASWATVVSSNSFSFSNLDNRKPGRKVLDIIGERACENRGAGNMESKNGGGGETKKLLSLT